MPVAAADLHSALNALWESAGLDAHFTALWTAAQITSYEPLNDTEAAPQQPFPYCIFESGSGTTTDRMSGHSGGEKHEIRDVPIQFTVYAKQLAESIDSRSAKQIAADMAEEILKIFGGHPTESPTLPTLTHGNALLLQYQTDYPVRQDNDVWAHVISYQARLDVPVAI